MSEYVPDNLTLFVCWQDTSTRLWHVVGRLVRCGSTYCFNYTKGATASQGFIPFAGMPQLHRRYESETLLPFFSNRVLQRTRPEYSNYLGWLGLDEVTDPLLQLARSGGIRGTDSLSMHPAPTPDKNGNYRVVFLCHGIRYASEAATLRISQLKIGQQLYPMHDLQNEWDKNALALRSQDPAVMLGYCPRFFAKDFRTLLGANVSPTPLITVARANFDAPIEFRLLCEFVSPWPKSFVACRGDEYEPLELRTAASKRSLNNDRAVWVRAPGE